ncbi:DUF6794 domain-containing protein, partial [uncultured Mucilaginibacter sp.]|uniref:DUF6794 domain-containing protein n=1 Tax=uncultured Mucilaginibacter sp. TaxID=797541 RepID=UPI0025D66443
MKVRALVFYVLFFAVSVCFGQGQRVPRNLKQAVNLLQTDCPDSLKGIIKKTSDNKLINLCYPWGDYTNYKTIDNWISDDNQGVKINKYLANKGIKTNQHQQTVILIAFKTMLLGGEVDEKQLFKPYQAIEAIWDKEDKVRFTTDTLRGHYIPKDINDCFRKLDLLVPDSDKIVAKSMAEDTFTSRYYFGLGFWVMNNWGLGSGSRLSVYFNSMGVYNNESMAGIVLVSYYRYLNGNPIHLNGQATKDKEFWKKSKEKERDDERGKFDVYKIGDTINYEYNLGYISKKQEDDQTNDKCRAKGVITARDTSKFYIKVKILETCDGKGIITYDSKNLLFFNAKLKKWEKFKKRKVKRCYNGDELWFNYE